MNTEYIEAPYGKRDAGGTADVGLALPKSRGKGKNKWLKRARKWRKRNKRVWDFWQRTSEQLAAALNQVEEYRRQGNEAIREVTNQREALLAWQKRVRQDLSFLNKYDDTGDAVNLDGALWRRLVRHIEAEAEGET